MDFGPIAVFISTPAVTAAVIIALATSGSKVTLDLAVGKERRKLNPWLTRVLLPLVPLALGALYGAFVPFRPAALLNYAAEHDVSIYAIGTAYGVVVGQFSDYVYTKIKSSMKAFSEAGERKRASTVPPKAS